MTRIEEIEARKAEILSAVDAEGADVNALEEEVRALNAEVETIKADAEKRQAIRDAVAEGSGETIKTFDIEERKDMTIAEIRNSADYINAYATYIKTNDDTECRALLSTNATDSSAGITGYVPVPDLVNARIRTAWERNEVMALVRKTNLKGNVKIGFELSATGAVIHKEGAAAPSEEEVILGIVTMVPQSIKKWITVSDEALDLNGEEFLNYIYDELTYRIAKKTEEVLIGIIAALPTTATATSVSAQKVAAAPALDTVAQAIGKVKGNDITIVMNRGTWAAFKAVQYAAEFAMDPFEGRNVIFSDALPSYADAQSDDVYMIVGDFFNGAQANFPNGYAIRIIVDEKSLAEKDLVKFVGREYVGIGAVSVDAFVNVVAPNS